MNTAPFVSERRIKNGSAYDVRPTPKLLKHFPDLQRDTFNSLSEANSVGYEWAKALVKSESGETCSFLVVPSGSVQALIESYKQSMRFKNIKSPKTVRSYLGHIKYAKNIEIKDLHQLTRSPTVPFAAMKASDIDYNYLHDMWMHIRNQVSAHKANHTFKVLKIVWKEGLTSGKIQANPFPLVKLPDLPDRQVMWTKDQVDGMVKYCDEQGYPSMGTMITMAYTWCQRVVDVRMRTWDELGTSEEQHTGKPIDVIRFTQQKTRHSANPARMSLQITPEIQDRFNKHHYRRNTHPYINTYEGTGKPYTDDRAVKVFRKLAEGYGLPKVTLEGQFDDSGKQIMSNLYLNDLRRTGTTHASQAGATDRELVALTGHKNPSLLVVYAVTGQYEASNAMFKRGLIQRA